MTGIDLKAQCKQEILIENLNSHLWRTLTWNQTDCFLHTMCKTLFHLVNNQCKVGFPWLLKIILYFCLAVDAVSLRTFNLQSFASSLTFFQPLVKILISLWNFERNKTMWFHICDHVSKKSVCICLPPKKIQTSWADFILFSSKSG